MSPTLNVHPTLFVNVFLGDYRFTVLQLLSLTKWCFIQISITHDAISSQVADKRRQGFGQWMNSSIIRDCNCKLLHRKCHPKSCHIDIEFRMTLNIMFSVVNRRWNFKRFVNYVPYGDYGHWVSGFLNNISIISPEWLWNNSQPILVESCFRSIYGLLTTTTPLLPPHVNVIIFK